MRRPGRSTVCSAAQWWRPSLNRGGGSGRGRASPPHATDGSPIFKALESRPDIIHLIRPPIVTSPMDLTLGESTVRSVDLFLIEIGDVDLESMLKRWEVRRALDLAKQRQARFIPILLHPMEWWRTPFASFQILPRDGRPLSAQLNAADALRDLVAAIVAVAEEIRAERANQIRVA